MHLRILAPIAAGALVLSAFAGTASASSHQTPTVTAHRHAARTVNPAIALYSQNDNDGNDGINSQDFEAAYDIYDDASADDFTVPAGHKWVIKSVQTTGQYYNGTGPAVSETVTFSKAAGGLPGPVVYATTVTGTDNAGSFTIPVKVKLRAGTYFVSVVANMNFEPAGQWAWESRSVQSGNPGAWRNPGGGWGSCTAWGATSTCLPGAFADYMFALTGRQV